MDINQSHACSGIFYLFMGSGNGKMMCRRTEVAFVLGRTTDGGPRALSI